MRWIEQDRDDNIWAGTAGAGLVRIQGERFDRLGSANGVSRLEPERLRTDPLTNLANRRDFDQALEAAWNNTDLKFLSLLLIDIDHFKQYNDALGHPAGDACLVAVARLLASSARHPGDVVARIGGEEFAVLLPDSATEAAHTVAERIRCGLRESALPHPASATAAIVTLSLGIATRTPQIERAHGLVVRADQALYLAKKGGRDRVVEAGNGLEIGTD